MAAGHDGLGQRPELHTDGLSFVVTCEAFWISCHSHNGLRY
jgi:hypothetical protein